MNNSMFKNQLKVASAPFDVLIGRAAMVGFVFALGAYLSADILTPGVI